MPQITGMPFVWLPRTAAGSIVLWSVQPKDPGQNQAARAYRAKAGRVPRIGLVLVSVALAVAHQTGVFTTLDAPMPDGNSVAILAVSPC